MKYYLHGQIYQDNRYSIKRYSKKRYIKKRYTIEMSKVYQELFDNSHPNARLYSKKYPKVKYTAFRGALGE